TTPARARRRWLSRSPRTTSRGVASRAWPARFLAARGSSVIAGVGIDLAAKHPVGPARIGEDDGNHDRHPDQHEGLAVGGCGRLPDCDAARYDIGPHADAEAGI